MLSQRTGTMDELLELMNNDGVDDSALIVNRDRDDDSHTEAEEHQKKNAVSSVESRNKENGGDRDRRKAARKRPTERSAVSIQPTHGTQLAEASIDDRLGIRMTNRLMPSNDLSELITDFTYFSPSVLSAMTLKRLNSQLQDPSPIIDPATVAGKTESLVTVGIVFSNSGTRISSKGGAFCVLTIGNLNSGPCLTVFLFGEAYGKYCVSSKPGKVIALLTPKLLPASRGDNGRSNKGYNADRTVSFSVYDSDQLKIVANARDYATCKAPTCKNYVDRRNSEYCDYHRRELQKSKGGKQTVNRFNQVKSVHRQASSILVASAGRKRNLVELNTSRKSNRFLNQSSAINSNSVKTVATSTNTSRKSNRFLNQSSVSNSRSIERAGKSTKMASIGNSSSIGFRGGNVPTHKTKKTQIGSLLDQKSNKIQRTSAGNSSVKKPLANRQAAYVGDNDMHGKGTNIPKKTSSSGNWLKDGAALSKERGPALISGRVGFSLSHFTKNTQRIAKTNTNPAAATNHNKKLNTAGNFDGSVSIPKPSKLFQQSSTPKEVPTKRIITPTMDSKVREKSLQQQAEVAKRIKEGKATKYQGKVINSTLPNIRVSASKSKQSNNGRTTGKSTEVNSFLAAMGGEIDEEKIRNARSQFADEVEADEYAKHRRKVVELEKLEASQESRNKKKNLANGKNNRMTKRWHCKNCRQTYTLKPRGCITKNHAVTTKYDLKEDVTKDERRRKLNDKSVEDGGLRLGMGLDWD
jgi:hypothetical protein